MSNLHPRPLEELDRIPPVAPPRTAVGAATPGRRYLIVQGAQIVGSSRLECALPEAHAAAGRLHPREALPAVLPVFRRYRTAEDPEKLRRFLQERDALGLRVVDPSGEEYQARVELISEWGDDTFVVHTAMEDARYWGGR